MCVIVKYPGADNVTTTPSVIFGITTSWGLLADLKKVGKWSAKQQLNKDY